MNLECSNITRELLPAVRIYAAEQLSSRYGMKQSEIARRLGIAQVAVSKYLNGKYSAHVKQIKERITSSMLVNETVRKVASMTNQGAIDVLINELCTRLAYDA
jgi:predicted transcriptional regulator